MQSDKNASFKVKIVLLILAAAVVAVALTIAAKFDMEASRFFYSENNVFSVIFACLGKAPAYLLLAASFSILYSYRNKESKFLSRFSAFVYLFAVFASFFLLIYEMCENIDTVVKIVLGLGIAPALSLLSVYLFSFIKKKDIKKLIKFAVSTIITVVAVIIITLIFKAVWGRVRFYEIIAGQGEFAPWYVFQRGGGSSMPSGHVALGATVFCLTALCDCFENLKNKRYIFYIVCFAYVFLTALSRIAAGAHFISDTVVAAFISFAVFIGVNWVFYGKYCDKIYFSDSGFYKLLMLEYESV